MAPRPDPTEAVKRRSQILDQVLRDHGDVLRRQARAHSQRPENDDDALDDACVSFMREEPEEQYEGGRNFASAPLPWPSGERQGWTRTKLNRCIAEGRLRPVAPVTEGKGS